MIRSGLNGSNYKKGRLLLKPALKTHYYAIRLARSNRFWIAAIAVFIMAVLHKKDD